MTRKDQIISDAEREAGIPLDANFDPGVLCDGDGCRHESCGCWDGFDVAVREQLAGQLKQSPQITFISHAATCALLFAFGVFFAVLVILPESEITAKMDEFWGLLK